MSAITELFSRSGDIMRGSGMSNDEAMEYVMARKNQEEFCLVRDWIWVDLELTDAERRVLDETHLQPALIYAHSVIFDTSRRWDVGDFVRTSPLYVFEQGFVFKTFNSSYVLLGDGQRKRAALDVVGHIF
ncbi:MAG: hypothetical protein V7681_15435 [Halopseudomonas sabulinigri]